MAPSLPADAIEGLLTEVEALRRARRDLEQELAEVADHIHQMLARSRQGDPGGQVRLAASTGPAPSVDVRAGGVAPE